jgi:hypothetical protein
VGKKQTSTTTCNHQQPNSGVPTPSKSKWHLTCV